MLEQSAQVFQPSALDFIFNGSDVQLAPYFKITHGACVIISATITDTPKNPHINIIDRLDGMARFVHDPKVGVVEKPGKDKGFGKRQFEVNCHNS
eukprot:2320081-Karenia_brevis.AAC.1